MDPEETSDFDLHFGDFSNEDLVTSDLNDIVEKYSVSPLSSTTFEEDYEDELFSEDIPLPKSSHEAVQKHRRIWANVFSNKTFKKANLNSVIKVEPPTLKVVYQDDLTPVTEKLFVYNISGTTQKVYILPPLSIFFDAKYEAKNWIPVGMCLVINITCYPQDLRAYKDWLRIVSAGDSNLMISLEAAPSIPKQQIPARINFGLIPLGQRVTRSFVLRPTPRMNVFFRVFLPQQNSDFEVGPLEGIIKEYHPPLNIDIAFTPTRYCTYVLPIYVYLPQLVETPYVVMVTATCKPGMLREILLEEHREIEANKQKFASKVEPPTSKKTLKPKVSHEQPEKAEVPLNSLYGISTFFGRKLTGRKSPHDLIGPMGRYIEEDAEIRKMKEYEFLRKLNMQKDLEEKVTKTQRPVLGWDQNEGKGTQEILNARECHLETYKVSLDVSSGKALYGNFQPVLQRRRTVRSAQEVCTITPTFDPILNDMWFVRYQVLCKFINAARTVIIRRRLLRRFKRIMKAFKEGKFDEPPVEEEEIK